jgi:hypothetical protein
MLLLEYKPTTGAQLAMEYHCRYCGGSGYKCGWDIEQASQELENIITLLREIADNQIDLKDSERRIRLYAILKGLGIL